MTAWEWAGALAIVVFSAVALGAIVISTLVRLTDGPDPTDDED